MSDTPNLDFLRGEVNKLKDLLDDPHPGLSTWNMAVANCLDKIVQWLKPKP
jgi:hypothetical protein